MTKLKTEPFLVQCVFLDIVLMFAQVSPCVLPSGVGLEFSQGGDGFSKVLSKIPTFFFQVDQIDYSSSPKALK